MRNNMTRRSIFRTLSCAIAASAMDVFSWAGVKAEAPLKVVMDPSWEKQYFVEFIRGAWARGENLSYDPIPRYCLTDGEKFYPLEK